MFRVLNWVLNIIVTSVVNWNGRMWTKNLIIIFKNVSFYFLICFTYTKGVFFWRWERPEIYISWQFSMGSPLLFVGPCLMENTKIANGNFYVFLLCFGLVNRTVYVVWLGLGLELRIWLGHWWKYEYEGHACFGALYGNWNVSLSPGK